MSVAHTTICARLGRDPELRTTKSGVKVCTLSLPTETGWGDHKKTTWWRVTLWGSRAESAAQHLRKGSWVCVQGKAGIEEWMTRENEKRFTAVIEGAAWDFVGPKQSIDSGFVERRVEAQRGEEPSLEEVPF